MATLVEQMIQQIKTLTDDEQRQIRVLLEAGTPEPAETTAEQERKFAEHLLAIGMIDHIPKGYPEGYVEPPPIVIQGEPLSETIIRERR